MRKPLALFCMCLFFVVQAADLEAQAGMRGADDALSRMDDAFARQNATAEDEYYLGRAVAANILAVYKLYNGNPELTRYLNRICQTIVINSAYPVIFNGYHAAILDSPEINAFSTPGGHILVTRGLVEAAATEDMLAAIIAHELAHIMLKHGITTIDNMRLHEEMSAMSDQAARLTGNTESARRLLYFRNSVSAAIDTLVKNGYSHEMEFEADIGAVVLLAASGYDPLGLARMLGVLQRVQASQRGGFNTTHPSPMERIANVEGWIYLYPVQDTGSYRSPRFKNK